MRASAGRSGNRPGTGAAGAVVFANLALGIAPDFGARPDQRRDVSLGDVADVCERSDQLSGVGDRQPPYWKTSCVRTK